MSAGRQSRLPKRWRTTPGIAVNVISSVITRFPTLADFAIERKMIKQGGHVSRNQTIEKSEHSINS
ncbi:MAG: hypothetical protein DME67_05125 [Verrucomicrobia bacterium]|nr:MAG: hypothetical protein DME95_00470 [Verrucomicrobiota bacterium]PYK05456.1 MAG: hypothetical protein DME67_05125 [Verrucomicrobiota bacterium]